MSIQNVALVGANGNLGSVILQTLLETGTFRVTVLKRASSKSSISEGLCIVEISELGQDAVIAAFPLRNVDEHLRLADAAAAAGTVKRFIPADYGSVDARSPRARELVKLFEDKVKVRERLEELAAASDSGFCWTSLVNGHFFDWGLTNGFLHFHPTTKKAEVLGDGSEKSSVATLGRISEAVVGVLQRLEETRNRVLMVQSFCVSQMEVLRSLERVMGEKWEVEYIEVDPFIKKHKESADRGNKDSIEELVFALGVIEGNWEVKEDFAMELLGLENEDLDEVVRKALQAAKLF
ncbi:NmrA family transcriptional regulator [Bombardia bombarda]|uniref:NmrA family transcriptional regulator n=1 Tax=Bombardia bombarda TaxID=252184 RepID=A0AA39X0R9_9PEZI|nr:NmrA family transcriptional regulator [Bombardia bombarda]